MNGAKVERGIKRLGSKIKNLVGTGVGFAGAAAGGFGASQLIGGAFERADEYVVSDRFTGQADSALALSDTLAEMGQDRGAVGSTLQNLFNLNQAMESGQASQEQYAAYGRLGISRDMDPMDQIQQVMSHISQQDPNNPRARLMTDLQAVGMGNFWSYEGMSGDVSFQDRYAWHQENVRRDPEALQKLRQGRVDAGELAVGAQEKTDTVMGFLASHWEKITAGAGAGATAGAAWGMFGGPVGVGAGAAIGGAVGGALGVIGGRSSDMISKAWEDPWALNPDNPFVAQYQKMQGGGGFSMPGTGAIGPAARGFGNAWMYQSQSGWEELKEHPEFMREMYGGWWKGRPLIEDTETLNSDMIRLLERLVENTSREN